MQITDKIMNFTPRASALGGYFNAKDQISATGEKMIIEDLALLLNDKPKKPVSSDFFEKGITMEEEGINIISEWLDNEFFLVKNKERRNNGFIEGECDIECKELDAVFDVKNAWDFVTFKKSELTKIYEVQVKCYCWLFERNNGFLAYVNNDMPDFLVTKEAFKLFYSMPLHERDSLDKVNEIEPVLSDYYKVSHFPIEDRLRIWDVGYNAETDIPYIKSLVEKVRAKMLEIYQKDLEFKKNLQIIKSKLLKK